MNTKTGWFRFRKRTEWSVLLLFTSLYVLLLTIRPSYSFDYSSGTNVWLERGVNKEVLLKAITGASDYLVRNRLPNGQFLYINDPLGKYTSKKKGGETYSLIRHLGAVYALLRAYQLTGQEKYMKEAEASLDFAYKFAVKTEYGKLIKGPRNRLSFGENGFFLIDAVLFNHLAGKKKYSDVTGRIVKFLVDNLHYDGPFSSRKKWAECQAVIGLAHYFIYEKQEPAILSVTYNWLKDLVKNGVHTHWTVQAFKWFDRMDTEKGKEFTSFAISGGKELLRNVTSNSAGSNSRLVGARGGRYGSCGVTARNEGLIAAYMIAENSGDMETARFFKARVEEHIAHAFQFQYAFEGNFFEGDRELERIRGIFDLDGGVFNRPSEGFIRIDYVSHFIRAMAEYYPRAADSASR